MLLSRKYLPLPVQQVYKLPDTVTIVSCKLRRMMEQKQEELLFKDAEILSFLHNVTNWFVLGIHLGVKRHKLKQIEVQHRDIERCKLEMVVCWRQSDPTASWPKLKEALRKRNYSIMDQSTVIEADGQKGYHKFDPVPVPTNPQEETPMARRPSVSSTTSSFDRRDEKVVNIPYCGKHKDLLQYFCSDPGCSQLLCCQCLATGKHSDHDWKELRQAFNNIEARLEQAAHAAQEAADTARRHMDAVCTEKGRVVSKCNTAKDSIRNKIRSIHNQLNDRQAHLKYNLDHAKRRQSYLNHKRPQETLKSKMDTLEELWEHEDATIANLAARDLMSLGEVEKAKGHLEKVKSDVRIIQQSVTTQHSSPLVSQFYADSEFVRAYLSNFGKVEVSTFTQVPGKHWTSYQPYEWNAGSSRPKERQRSASESVPNSASSASWKTRTTRCASLGSKHATESSASKKQLLNVATSRRKSVMKNRELPPIPQESSHDQNGDQVQITPSLTRRPTSMLKNRALPPVPQESPSDQTTNRMQTMPSLSSASMSLSSTSMLKDGTLPHNFSLDQSTERPHSSAPGSTDTLTNRRFVLPPFPPFNPLTQQPHPPTSPISIRDTTSGEENNSSLQQASNLDDVYDDVSTPLHPSTHHTSVAVPQYSDNKTEEYEEVIYEEPPQEEEYDDDLYEQMQR